MALDLLSLRAEESERIAYASNFNVAAKLFARLADAQNRENLAIEHLKTVLQCLTETNDRESLTRAVMRAYVFLEKLGYDIRPSNTLEDHDNG